MIQRWLWQTENGKRYQGRCERACRGGMPLVLTMILCLASKENNWLSVFQQFMGQMHIWCNQLWLLGLKFERGFKQFVSSLILLVTTTTHLDPHDCGVWRNEVSAVWLIQGSFWTPHTSKVEFYLCLQGLGWAKLATFWVKCQYFW